MKQRYTYDSGLPFREDLAKDILEPITKNLVRQPAAIIIDGAPGTGKTTLAVHICDYLEKKPIKLEKESGQLAMGGLDLQKKAEICREKGYKVLVFDEADLTKGIATTKYHNILFGFFREYRSLGILLIIVIQNVSWLSNKLWDLGIVQGLIHLYNPRKNYTEYQVYDLTNLSWLLERMEKLSKFQNRLAYARAHGYQRGEFLPLPPRRQAKLDALSNMQKDESRKKRIKALEESEGDIINPIIGK